jgi:hypothetical protein
MEAILLLHENDFSLEEFFGEHGRFQLMNMTINVEYSNLEQTC